MDLKRSTISTTTMITGACYSPLCSGGKEKLSFGWSADAPFSCSVFLTVGRIHPATLGISSLPASSLFVGVARIHARATREKRFSFSMIEELARRLGYWIFFFVLDVPVLWRSYVICQRPKLWHGPGNHLSTYCKEI